MDDHEDADWDDGDHGWTFWDWDDGGDDGDGPPPFWIDHGWTLWLENEEDRYCTACGAGPFPPGERVAASEAEKRQHLLEAMHIPANDERENYCGACGQGRIPSGGERDGHRITHFSSFVGP